MKSIVAKLILAAACSVVAPMALAQALPAGGSLQDKWQLGIAGSLVNSGYISTAIPGGMVYGTYTPMRYFSLEGRAHFANTSGGEREYSLTGGYRFNFPAGRLIPYAGGLMGVGHFSDAQPHGVVGNRSNSFVISYLAGVEVPVTSHLNWRVLEVEAQVWTGFPPNGLNPVLYSMGVAYHR
jgi:hypothetical protein